MNNLTTHYPEMWGTSTGEIQAENTCIGSKPYRVKSKAPLEISRGVEYTGLVGEFGSGMVRNKDVGWHKYYMTEKAFDKLVKENGVVLNCLLD